MFSRRRNRSSSRSSGGNYPYVVARVRALKTYLLGESAYPKLIARDVHEIARTLEEGQYKEEVDELASQFSGARLIERATRLSMGREFRRILSWCKGEPHELLRLYFHRYEVHNLKTALRGAHTNAPKDERQMALIPAGVVPEQRFLPALEAGSIEECIAALEALPYGDVLRRHQEEPLPTIENELDIAYYQQLAGAVKATDRATEAFLDFIKREIDIVNLKLILRAKHGETNEYALVPGGSSVNQDLARRIQSAEWREVAGLLEETPYGSVLKEAVQAYLEDRDLNAVATALDRYHLDEASDFGHRYPLSILPIIDYVLRKRHEVDLIRMIAYGKEAGFSRDEIEELVHP